MDLRIKENKDRHLCKTCKYRESDKSPNSMGNRCAYIFINHHSRGCDPDFCTTYEEGEAATRRVGPFGRGLHLG